MENRFETTWMPVCMRYALTTLVAFLAVGAAMASPISALQARRGIGTWVRSRPAAHMGARLGAVATVRTVKDAGGEDLFHVVNLEGGGFVVTPTDDRILPVIAFSENGTLDEDVRNPLWNLLRRDLPRRLAGVRSVSAVSNAPLLAAAASSPALVLNARQAVSKWKDLLAAAEDGATSDAGLSQGRLTSVSDVRVPVLMRTKWNQKRDNVSANCYNYFTPNNWYCGCVATATAQLMRYQGYPTEAVAAETFYCWVGEEALEKTMMGGTYDWESMPYEPGEGTTDAQRQAIGKLCYDVGVASRMQWTSSGSGACLLQTAISLTNVFRYANARSLQAEATVGSNVLQNAVFANLDAACPVLLGIRNAEGTSGHAIVADGYGYDGSIAYTHLNLGWGGSSDAWYALPNIGTSYDFSVVDTLVYNIFPETTGELLTGRVTEGGSNAVAGATVTLTSVTDPTDVRQETTNERGIYAAHVSAGRWRVGVAATGFDPIAEKTVTVARSVSTTLGEISYEGYTYYDDGSVGNSWGNDFAFGTDPEPEPEPEPACDLYVYGDYGSDSNDGTSWETAKRTIQAAVDAAADGATIYVAPGGYAPFATGNRPLTIESAYGSYHTWINAGWRGRCADMGSEATHTNTALVGFALLYGYAEWGGGASGGRLYRCVVTGNEAATCGGGLYNSQAFDCEISYNYAVSSGGGAAGGKLVNCTVVENGVESDGTGGGTSGGTAVNCIVWENWIGNEIGNCDGGTFTRCLTWPAKEGDNLCEDPRFFDSGNGDFTLRYDSPCLDAGDNGAVVEDYDASGWDRIINGTVDLGAYEGFTLDVPQNVAASDGTSSEAVTVTWSAVAGATSYAVYRASEPNANSATQIGSTDVPSFDDTTCDTWTTYWYWVVAAADGGAGVASSSDTGYRYQANTCYLVYVANGGAGKMSPQVRSTTGAANLTQNAFTRGGHAFMGWALTPTGARAYANGQYALVSVTPGEIVYLYAVWAACDADGFVVEDGVVAGWTSVGTTDITLPEGVTNVANRAFAGSSVTSIAIPSSAVTLGANAFDGCDALTNLVLYGCCDATYAATKWGSKLDNAAVRVSASCFDYWSAIWGNDIGVIGSALGTVREVALVGGAPGYEMTLPGCGGTFVVEEAWLASNGISTVGGVTAGLMSANGRNGIPRYESYLFGLDPESETPASEQLKVEIAFDGDGLPSVTCSPTSASPYVSYTTLGKATLGAEDWVPVTDENRADMKFFRIRVEVK